MNDALDIFMKLARIVPMVAFSLFSLPVAHPQQVTGSISGSARDSSGLALDRAQLKLLSMATGAERVAQTNESGDFVIRLGGSLALPEGGSAPSRS